MRSGRKRGVEWPNGTEFTFAFAPCDEPTNSLIICPSFCCSPTPLQLDAGRNPVIRQRPKSASPSGSRDIAVARSIVSGYLLNKWKDRRNKKKKEIKPCVVQKLGHLSSLISTRKRRVAPAGRWMLGYKNVSLFLRSDPIEKMKFLSTHKGTIIKKKQIFFYFIFFLFFGGVIIKANRYNIMIIMWLSFPFRDDVRDTSRYVYKNSRN